MKWLVPSLLVGLSLIGPPPPPPEPSAAQRWLDRADKKLDVFTRQMDLDRQNFGANGRKNATRGEQRQDELPWLQPRPLSDW